MKIGTIFTFLFLTIFVISSLLSPRLALAVNTATITTDGDYTIFTYTSSGYFNPRTSGNIETLVVAGGGGGGGSGVTSAAGAGGAGGLVYDDDFSVTAQNYAVTVGAGGNGGEAGTNGTVGSNSVFSTLTALGGGYGARQATHDGGDGGSGGGGGASIVTPGSGGEGLQSDSASGGFGNDGADGVLGGAGGGGGGADAAASDGTGGAGKNYFGETYATGGSGTTGNTDGAAATNNKGDGGDGAGEESNKGGNGGSGVVIIRFKTSDFPNATSKEPSIPEVETQPATDITDETATLQGRIVDDGDANCEARFRYSVKGADDWTETDWQAAATTGTSFSQEITELTPETEYEFQAQARNLVGSSAWTASAEFETLELILQQPPSVLNAYPVNSTIDLQWQLGNASESVFIRWKIGGYPTGLFDGNEIGTITEYNYLHENLTPGTSYYYRVWGVLDGNTSVTSATVMGTTSYTSPAGAIPTAPGSPDGWTGAFDDSELVDLPVYEFGNMMADEAGLPTSTFWGIGIMGAMIVVALLCYNLTHNLFLTCISIMIGLVALGAMKVVPFMLVGLFIIIALIVTIKEARSI